MTKDSETPEAESHRITKRRSGAAAGEIPVADPRPRVEEGAVLGTRCTRCGYPSPQEAIPWCAACYGPVRPERFATVCTVFSSTVVEIPVGRYRPPFGLAYVDIDDGPRLLVHLVEPVVRAAGTRMHVATGEHGDLFAYQEVL